MPSVKIVFVRHLCCQFDWLLFLAVDDDFQHRNCFFYLMFPKRRYLGFSRIYHLHPCCRSCKTKQGSKPDSHLENWNSLACGERNGRRRKSFANPFGSLFLCCSRSTDLFDNHSMHPLKKLYQFFWSYPWQTKTHYHYQNLSQLNLAIQETHTYRNAYLIIL